MPAKKPKPHHLSLLTVSSVLVIISSGFLMTHRQPISHPILVPTPTTTPTPTDFPGMKLNVNTMSIGDRYGGLVLREIKPTHGNTIDKSSNLTITFQGQLKLSGVSSDKCFIPDNSSVILLPRLSNTRSILEICFTEKLRGLSKNITIDNYSLVKDGIKNFYTATLLATN